MAAMLSRDRDRLSGDFVRASDSSEIRGGTPTGAAAKEHRNSMQRTIETQRKHTVSEIGTTLDPELAGS